MSAKADLSEGAEEQTGSDVAEPKVNSSTERADLPDPELAALDPYSVEEIDWPELTFPEPRDASLVISADDHETRVAYLIDDVPTEFFFDRSQDVSLVGNIYKGRIVRVLSSMQAAFVDIGLKQAAFLYIVSAGAREERDINPNEPLSESVTRSTYTQTIDLETGRSIQQLHEVKS